MRHFVASVENFLDFVTANLSRQLTTRELKSISFRERLLLLLLLRYYYCCRADVVVFILRACSDQLEPLVRLLVRLLAKRRKLELTWPLTMHWQDSSNGHTLHHSLQPD